MNEKIGIIGFGNMGSAIAEHLKSEYSVCVFDKDKAKTKDAKGLSVAASATEAVNKSDVLMLAVKPQDFDHLLREIKNSIKDKLIISIAAGISTKHIEKTLGSVRVIRAMPNMGAKIGESVTCICKGAYATEDDLSLANELFYYIGDRRDLSEDMMDAATAISGSGPGYIFDFIEKEGIDPSNVPDFVRQELVLRLQKAAEKIGFSPEDAVYLATSTTSNSLNVIKITKLPAAELRKQVASKGGTTEAGLEVLNKNGTWEEAAQAALRRAKELAKGN